MVFENQFSQSHNALKKSTICYDCQNSIIFQMKYAGDGTIGDRRQSIYCSLMNAIVYEPATHNYVQTCNRYQKEETEN